MKYEDLQDTAIKRIGKTDKAEKFTVHKSSGGQGPDLQRLRWMREKGHIEDDSFLDFALSQARQTEERIRKAKTQNLPGSELKKLREQSTQTIIRAVEKKKRDMIEVSLNRIDERRKAHEERERSGHFSETSREALRLEKLKLQHSYTPETAALARMAGIERTKKYDPLELLVLSAKSEKAFNRAAEIREEIPEFLSDDGGQLIGSVEGFTATHEGQLIYDLKNGGARQSVFVADLLDDENLSPKLSDIEV
jgi:hypothetical protein